MNTISRILTTVLFAIEYAIKAHGDQTRKDGFTPYIVHPVGVACILAELGITDPDVLNAAILHDTIEDTSVTAENLRTEFGEEVLDIVVDLTQDKKLSKPERKRAEIEEASVLGFNSAIVKLADCTYNLRSLYTAPPKWESKRIDDYIKHLIAVVEELTLDGKYKSVFFVSIK